jgi:YfiH family protein
MFAVGLPGATATFSTREGGLSEGPYESLNLGFLTDDLPEHVAGNRAILAEAIGVDPGSIAMGIQVHGADVKAWPDPPGRGAYDRKSLADGDQLDSVDGHTTTLAGLGLLVLVADCFPVALSGEGGIAMLHCGWRGLAAGILERGLENVGPAPAAAVGPGIGPCCYEVGDEVRAEFADVPDAAAGRMLDLRAVVDARLRRAGVESIEHVDLCTSCRPDLFFSHRRDAGVTGRQAGVVVREAA